MWNDYLEIIAHYKLTILITISEIILLIFSLIICLFLLEYNLYTGREHVFLLCFCISIA